MKGFLKILLIVGIALSLLGGTIFTVAMSLNGWDFGVLASHSVSVKTDEIESAQDLEKITEIKIDASTAEIKILYHDEQKITVVGYDLKTSNGEITDTIEVKVNENRLEIIEKQKKIINFETGTKGKREIIVKIPSDKVVSLNATLSTGKVFIGEENKGYQFESVKIFLTTGDVKLNGNINCKRFTARTTTGDLYFNGDLTCEAIAITSSTGDAFVNGKINTGTLEKECSTGDFIINNSIIARKIEIEQGTGKITCNAFITADEMDIETSTGDVYLKLLGSDKDYSYSYEISTGKSNIPSFVKGSKRIEVESATGDVTVIFEE